MSKLIFKAETKKVKGIGKPKPSLVEIDVSSDSVTDSLKVDLSNLEKTTKDILEWFGEGGISVSLPKGTSENIIEELRERIGKALVSVDILPEE